MNHKVNNLLDKSDEQLLNLRFEDRIDVTDGVRGI